MKIDKRSRMAGWIIAVILSVVTIVNAQLIVDEQGNYNGATGAFTTDFSNEQGGIGYNNSNSRHTPNTSAAATQTSLWTFTGLADEYYIVHAGGWTAGVNRSQVAPYEIFDGDVNGTLRSSMTLNQEIAPNDLSVDDGQGVHNWERLDVIRVTSGTLTVRLSGVDNSGNSDYIFADAIRLAPITNAVHIISADGTLYHRASGSGVTTFGGPIVGGYNSDGEYYDDNASDTTLWTFKGLVSGKSYHVHTLWTTSGNRFEASPFEIFDGTVNDTIRSIALVDQYHVTPNDLTIDDGEGSHTWESLGAVHTTNGAITVRLKGSGTTAKFCMATAIRLSMVTNESIHIIDSSDTATGAPGRTYGRAMGSFVTDLPNYLGAGTGYNYTKTHHSGNTALAANQSAVWTFDGLLAGRSYKVYTRWIESSNRSQVAPYDIFDGTTGDTLKVSVTVNQRNAPDDLTVNDGEGDHAWELLAASVPVTGDTLTVRLTGVDNSGEYDYVFSDAVRLEILPPPEGTMIIIR